MSWDVTDEEILRVLEKLRIKPGLIGDKRRIAGPWSVGFFYSREHSQFGLSVHFGNREKVMGLRDEDVESRSKGTWMTDKTWRLSATGIDTAFTNIRGAIDKTPRENPVYPDDLQIGIEVGTTWKSPQGFRTIEGERAGRFFVRTEGLAGHQIMTADDIAFEMRRDAANLRSRARWDDERAADEARAAALSDTRGFYDTLSAAGAGRAKKVLETTQGFNGKIMTRKVAMEQLVAKGWRPRGKRLESPDGETYYEQHDITKTAMDYAAHLAALEDDGYTENPGDDLPTRAGEEIEIRAHGKTLVVKRVRGSWFMKIEGSREHARWADTKKDAREDIDYFLSMGALPKSGGRW